MKQRDPLILHTCSNAAGADFNRASVGAVNIRARATGHSHAARPLTAGDYGFEISLYLHGGDRLDTTTVPMLTRPNSLLPTQQPTTL